MSEPRRWKDSPDAPVGMRELIGSAKRSRPLDEGTFRRGAERAARFSVAPAALAAVSIWTKLAAAGAVGLAAAGAVVAVELHRVPPEPATAIVVPAVLPPSSGNGNRNDNVLPVEPTPATVDRAAVPTPAYVPVKTSSASSPPPTAAKVRLDQREPEAEVPSAKSSLSDELTLLEAARSHMARSPQTALARLAEHRARHPSGTLASERDLMELDALRRTGRVQDARDRAHAWLGADPNGIYATRVRVILRTLDEP